MATFLFCVWGFFALVEFVLSFKYGMIILCVYFLFLYLGFVVTVFYTATAWGIEASRKLKEEMREIIRKFNEERRAWM